MFPFENIQGCPNMIDLNIAWCNVTDASLIVIADCCPNIQSLNINGCPKITNISKHKFPYGCKIDQGAAIL